LNDEKEHWLPLVGGSNPGQKPPLSVGKGGGTWLGLRSKSGSGPRDGCTNDGGDDDPDEHAEGDRTAHLHPTHRYWHGAPPVSQIPFLHSISCPRLNLQLP
jgi:hypothetical protein